MSRRSRSAAASGLVALILLAANGCGAGQPPAPQSQGDSGVADMGDWDPVDVRGVASCGVLDRMADPASPPANDGMPPLRLPCLTSGPDVDLAELRGRPVLVNIWASWCGPCRKEMPLLTGAHRQFGDQIQFVGLNTADAPPAAARFLEEYDVRYPQLADPNNVLLDRLRIPGLPVTLVLGADGSILEKHIGPYEGPELDQLLADLAAT